MEANFLMKVRSLTRAGIVFVLLISLCSLAGTTDGELQSMIVGALIGALSTATIFYFQDNSDQSGSDEDNAKRA